MKTFFSNVDAAFEPFFDAPVVIVTKSGETQTINACVMADSTGDALTDVGMDADREDIQILVRRSDWAFCRKLKRGDSVSLDCGKRYFVQSVVDDFNVNLIIKARESK